MHLAPPAERPDVNARFDDVNARIDDLQDDISELRGLVIQALNESPSADWPPIAARATGLAPPLDAGPLPAPCTRHAADGNLTRGP